MAAMELETGKVDEALYSRQLYVLGREGQSKMASSTVLVCGLTGTGAELAKNVILAGVKAVTLFDPTPVTWADLGGNPYRAGRKQTDALSAPSTRVGAVKGARLVRF